ncbi:MAG: hypothetical protein DMD64_15085 [Gemmatimonadetes bacterium]|nr:MAG: hypothetical protein DMD64_15085 [Gemmatimonadota bacterium]
MRRRPLQPADHEDPQVAVPGEQRRHSDSGVAREAGGGEGLVEDRFRRRILGIRLHCEATLPHANLECGAGARRVPDQIHGDGSILEPQGQERARQAQRPAHAERAHRHDPR